MIGTVPTIRQDLIPTNTPHDRRPQNKLDYEYVTVHNTANKESSAAGERSWLTNASNNRQASWHYCVDQKEAVLAIPENENAWHAGDGNGPGNRKSVSIEMCESGDWNKTYSHMVGLTAYLLNKKGLGIDKLKKHQDWSGKYCPRMLIPMWSTFVADVKATMASLKGGTKAPAPTPAQPTKPKGDPIMKGTVNTPTLNVRSTYSTAGNIVGTVKKGDIVEIFAETAGFYQIGTNRWVGAAYVDVAKKSETPATQTPTTPAVNTAPWKLEGIKYLHEQGLLDDLEGWSEKIDEDMPVWAVTTILANIAKKVGGAK